MRRIACPKPANGHATGRTGRHETAPLVSPWRNDGEPGEGSAATLQSPRPSESGSATAPSPARPFPTVRKYYGFTRKDNDASRRQGERRKRSSGSARWAGAAV